MKDLAVHMRAVQRLYPWATDEMLMGRSRTREVVEARHTLWYSMYRDGYGPVAIGRLVGRDHATVIAAIRVLRARNTTPPASVARGEP